MNEVEAARLERNGAYADALRSPFPLINTYSSAYDYARAAERALEALKHERRPDTTH